MQHRFSTLVLLLAFCLIACDRSQEPEINPAADPDYNERSVFYVSQQPASSVEKMRLGKNLGAADFVPLGLMVGPYEQITVTVEIPDGTSAPGLLMGTYSRNDWNYTPAEFGLSTAGPRTLTNPTAESQLLYVRYNGYDEEKEAVITVEGGRKVPFFVLGESDNAAFVSQLRDFDKYVDVQLMSRRGMVVLGRSIALKYIHQDWEQLMETLDGIIETEEFISGLDGSSSIHSPTKNRYLLTQTRDTRYWMAATNYRTFYNAVDAIDFVADRQKLFSDGWGPWHEIGHQHQLSAITWNETVEVTVNIYSLAVERAFGHTSRLKRENRWPAIMNYLALPEAEKDYNDPSLGPFLRLGLYQQLWLAYGDEFFIQLHQAIREEQPDIQLKEEKMGYLMRKASVVSGHDLSNFFRRWGFRVGESYYAELAALGLPQPDEDPAGLSD